MACPRAHRGRLFLLLPVLALLFGALPFVASPAQAQTTVWYATLTVKNLLVMGTPVSVGHGCWGGGGLSTHCGNTAVLTDDDFSHDGTDYTVVSVVSNAGSLEIALEEAIPQSLRTTAKLYVGSSAYTLTSAVASNSDKNLTWTDSSIPKLTLDAQVSLSLVVPASIPLVSLSASPNPVPEGSGVTVAASLSTPLSENVTIPLTFTDGSTVERDHGAAPHSAEPEDYGTLPSITIYSGSTIGRGRISTNQDHDKDDETFTVGLGSLPASVAAGRPGSVRVTITDDDNRDPGTPTGLRLTAKVCPPPGDFQQGGCGDLGSRLLKEGGSVEIGAQLDDAAPEEGVRVSVTFTGTATQGGDYDAYQDYIHIGAGRTSGSTVLIDFHDDGVADDGETVLVRAVGDDPVLTAELRLTVADGDGGTKPNLPTVSLSASPNPVDEGWGVTVTATLSSGAASRLAIPLKLSNGTAEDGDYDDELPSIPFNIGERSGTVRISTNKDEDVEDETFTVALGDLPRSVTAGSRSSVAVTIRDDGPTPTTVSLSASPSLVREGEAVTVTARLSSALSSSVRIPLLLTRETAEVGDYGSLSSITINSGETSGTGTISTNEDDDTEDETFTVALGSSLPSEVTAASRSPVTVTIWDPTQTTPTVLLSASPNPVVEGEAVTVSARLSSALSSSVRIPLLLTRETAEVGDYGSLSSITINSGETSGTGTLSTNEDADRLDETFTVALGSLPASVREGSSSSVEVTISDSDKPTVSLSASPNPVDEGEAVTVTVRLSSALSSDVTIPLTLTDGSADDGDYGSLSSIMILSGSTSGSGRIWTSDDADTDDEAFTVTLGSLPTSVTAGSPSSVAVTIQDSAAGAQRKPEPQVLACTAETGPLCGIGLSAGSEAVALSPAFAPGTLSYRAEVPAGSARVSLTPHWGGEPSVFAGARAPGAGGASYTRPTRVRAVGHGGGAQPRAGRRGHRAVCHGDRFGRDDDLRDRDGRGASGAVLGREPERADGEPGGERGGDVLFALDRDVRGGHPLVRRLGRERRHAPEADADGERVERDGESGQGGRPAGGVQRHGEPGDFARRGLERRRGRGHRAGRDAEHLHGDGDAGRVLRRHAERADGERGGERGGDVLFAVDRDLRGGDHLVRGLGDARRHAREADPDEGARRRLDQGGDDGQSGRGRERHGERRHRALGGLERHRGRGHGGGRDAEDVHGDGGPGGGGAADGLVRGRAFGARRQQSARAAGALQRGAGARTGSGRRRSPWTAGARGG